jgi:Nucleoside 2-deoxyribosyltransferase like
MKKVFLGGTVNGSKWRDELISHLNINYFNPAVEEWNEAAQKRELEERLHCDFCLYVLTPKMTGVYSVAEVVDDSNKRPHKTIFSFLQQDGKDKFSDFQIKSLDAVGKMVEANGAKYFTSLREVWEYLNRIS